MSAAQRLKALWNHPAGPKVSREVEEALSRSAVSGGRVLRSLWQQTALGAAVRKASLLLRRTHTVACR